MDEVVIHRIVEGDHGALGALYDKGRATVAGWLLMMARSRAIDRVRARQARPIGTTTGEIAIATLADGAAGQEATAMRSPNGWASRSAP